MPIDQYVSGVDRSPAFADEVRQLCRSRMLLGTDGQNPTIATYSGRGPLARWVRIAAVRTALSQRNRPDDRHPRAPDPERLLPQLPGDESPEETYLRGRYRAEFKQAVTDAFEALTPEQRNVLSMYVIDDLGTPELGRPFGVNSTTVWRWLERARKVLSQRVRELLRERLGLRESELDSMLRLVDSKVDVSIPRLLKDKKKS